MGSLQITNDTQRGFCPEPFYQLDLYPGEGGYIDGRLCAPITLPQGSLTCCLACPMTDWVYPDNFNTISLAADWISVVGTICCAFLLLSWAFLPVEKTHRHFLSISLTFAVILMNLGFIIPLAARPSECFDNITPNGMKSSNVCAASGAFLIFGGWAGVMWIFLRALSLHLQICWQLVVGRTYMWFSSFFGWAIPSAGLAIALSLSGVSFRFGTTCHINHDLSLADFWIPLLAFAGLTVIIQFATFGYCIKVYVASLADNSATTGSSGLPSYTASIATMTPRQAYRRVRRVIELQWRGMIIVLIIIADVIFFAVVFVFQDNTVEEVKDDPQIAQPWIECLLLHGGEKEPCLEAAGVMTVPMATVMAVLILLGMNGIWLLLLLGRWSMVTGWMDKMSSVFGRQPRKEFVSVDARMELKNEPRSYEMLSRESSKKEPVLTAVSHANSPSDDGREGRHTPDYFAASRYQSPEPYRSASRQHHPHHRSFSAPRPPPHTQVSWDATATYAPAQPQNYEGGMNPLGMNRL